MTILTIDTSTNICSAALTEGEKVIDSRIGKDVNHARNLPLFIESLLQTARDNDIKIGAVALSAGPGSYTGLRIGTATAKGLCYGLQIPLIAIDTLQVLCASLGYSGYATRADNEWLCPMIDARRMEVYTALFDANGNRQTEVTAQIIDSESYKNVLADRRLVFFGNGSDKCKKMIVSDNAVFVDEIVPLADAMGVLAQEKFDKKDFVDLAYFAPLYLKEFQATVSHKVEDVLKK